MQTEQLLCWSDMTDTEHSATSGSNEVVTILCSLMRTNRAKSDEFALIGV